MKENQIVYINVDKLHPHELNPRKDIGDVTELAESIKSNGIMQNLTVVPSTGYWYGDYTVIIGHRRLAAAKQVGLTEVPCVITEMTQEEQLATMLLENMQRSDLTIYEQAQGMQMMLDLGETVESISEKTGFSQSTVRRRVRLTKLDTETFRSVQGRQIDITDYDKLFDIEDDNKRNELLKEIGTQNFNWYYNQAVHNEKVQKQQTDAIEYLNRYGKEISDTEGFKYVTCIDSVSELPEDLDGGNYFYKPVHNGYVQIYKEYTEEERAEMASVAQIRESERIEKEERRRQLEDLYKQAFDMRFGFIKNLNNFKGKETVIYKMAGIAICKADKSWRSEINEKIFNAVMSTELKPQFSFEELNNSIDWSLRSLLALSYSFLEKGSNSYYDYSLKYCDNDDLDTIYECLSKLGYEMSDEEKRLVDGTHELYVVQEV